MVAVPNHSVLAVLLSDAGVERDTESAAQAPAPCTASELSEELDGERDLGSLDLQEDYEEYHERGFYHPFD